MAVDETLLLSAFGLVFSTLGVAFGYIYGVQRSVGKARESFSAALGEAHDEHLKVLGEVRDGAQAAVSQLREQLRQELASHTLEDARVYVPKAEYREDIAELKNLLGRIEEKIGRNSGRRQRDD